MSAPITRDATNKHRDLVAGVDVHEPEWSDIECKWCGDGGCGPHPDVLVCKECSDDWPCHVIEAVADEVERLAETLHTSCRIDDLMATVEAGARNGVRNELLARASELRGGVSGTGDQP